MQARAQNRRGKKSELKRGGKDRHRGEDRNRRSEIRRSLAVPDDGLHFFLGEDARAARKHCAVFAECLRPDSIHLSQSRRERPTNRQVCVWRSRRNRSRQTALSVRRDCSAGVERVSSKHSDKLSVRTSKQLPRILRSLPGLEIGGADAQLASGLVRPHCAGFATRTRSSRNQNAGENVTEEWRSTNDEKKRCAGLVSDFVIRICFVIRHSDFVI